MAEDRIDMHEARLGETVDGFYLAETLYESDVSTLYCVTHEDYATPLVMKVPKLDTLLPSSTFAGFESEMRMLSRLHGVYTPKVFARGDFASTPYLVLEYIEGDDLQQAVARAPLDENAVRELMRPVCKAVHELHRHNIIHLDLKPPNIRNRADGSVVIIDLGTAHHTQMPDMYEIAHESPPRTLSYVAPEQLRDIRNDSRSDIYALGVILYQLLTGQLPHGKPNELSVKKKLYFPPKPPRAVNPELSPWMQEVILTCLEVRPEQRFASAKQIAYALAHPAMVELSARSHTQTTPGIGATLRQWLAVWRHDLSSEETLHPSQRTRDAPHVLVAVDPEHASPELQNTLLNIVKSIKRMEKQCYFTCLSIIDKHQPEVSEDAATVASMRHPRHVQRQAELRHWLAPLKLAASRVNYQVYQGDPAGEIIRYARLHAVDHIVMGAQKSGRLNRFLGSVSNKVASEVECPVTLVRTPRDRPESRT